MAKKKKEYKELKVNQAPAPAAPITTFKRSRWKHFLRMFIFGVLVMLYLMFIYTAYHTHVLLHQGFHPKEGLALFLAICIALPVFPSVFLEADSVSVEPDGLVIKNLLVKNKVFWTDIKSFINPIYLKFSILKGKKFVYLLNRRDLSNYDLLVETIESNAAQLKEAAKLNSSDEPK